MRVLWIALAIAGAALGCAPPALAQAQGEAAAYAEDGASVETLLAATYAVISGPAGQKRDWDRFRALFLEGAYMVPRAVGASGLRRLSPEDYIARSGPILERDGFFETETARSVRRYGDIAQVFSTYEARRAPTDAEPLFRGINAFQLVFDGARWRIASLTWQQAGEGLPIPEEFGG